MSHGQRMPYCLSYLRWLNMLVYYPIQVTWVTSCIKSIYFLHMFVLNSSLIVTLRTKLGLNSNNIYKSISNLVVSRHVFKGFAIERGLFSYLVEGKHYECSLNPNKYLFCLNIRYFNYCIYQVLQLGTWDSAADIQLNSTTSRLTFILSPQQRPLNEGSQLLETSRSSFFITFESLPLLLLLPFYVGSVFSVFVHYLGHGFHLSAECYF